MREFRTTVDIAGGRHGGAARFLAELDRVLADYPDVQIIGRPSSLTPRWLFEREIKAKAPRKIALNNASFWSGEERIVLLRNALHFSDAEEFARLNFTPSKELRAQIPVIRLLARRASRVVVPCTSMKERVLRYTSIPEERIDVRFHPVGQIVRAPETSVFRILMPIVNSPYKQLEKHVSALLAALTLSGIDGLVELTGSAGDYPAQVSGDPRVRFIGVISSARLANHWREVSAVYFPMTTEAFGYPLAEARVHGVPVIAVDTEQNREIAAGALRAFVWGDVLSLAEAVGAAADAPVAADPEPFDPAAYFSWLLRDH